MRTLIACGSYLLQPLVWLAVLRLWLVSRARIKQERKDFGSAVYSDHFELRHMLTQGILLGAGLSLINILVGFSLPVVWILVYEVLALVTLIVLPTTILPLTLIVVATAITIWSGSYITNSFSLDSVGLTWQSVGVQNYLWLGVLFFLLMGHWVAHYGGRFISPRIYAKQRGKRIAGYPWREFLILPMVTLVPGDWFTSQWAFWPVLHLHGQSFAILVLPLVLGLRFTVFRQAPRAVYQRLAKKFVWLGVVAAAFLGGSFLWPAVTPILLILLLVGYALVLWQAKHYDERQQFWYSQVDDGVRVLAIRPGTPAAKLDLAAGDIILECNHCPINSETSFYEALLANSAYCHLRVRDMNGELKMTETAIYSGAPHEIGIVLFRDLEG